MKTIEQARNDRARNKVIGKFHTGHFPVGTRVLIEDVFTKLQPGQEKYSEYEMYGRREVTVAGIVWNGPNSILLKLVEGDDLQPGANHVNIDWVRKIIARGTGKLSPEDQLVIDELDAEEAVVQARWKTFEGSLQKDGLPSTKGKYRIELLQHFLHNYITQHPQYCNAPQMHLIDTVKLNRLMVKALAPYTTLSYVNWGVPRYDISKKRFAKLFSAAFVRCKVSRKKVAVAEERALNEQYAKEMQYELEND